MRFIPQGPFIPDELLIAQDAGDVLFFCGAGVSFAQAKLPDFVTLAESVLDSLGSATASPARKLFEASRKFERETQLRGLVATDRIFGMLEREFDPRDVRSAVAAALKPKEDVSLAAHRILLDLSTSPTGATRLVTTNFDRLFEQCDPELAHSNPPHLPDPMRPRDFHGVIHLHGCVDSEYRHAIDEELVLSSADFGHAYLSDGWAARYIQRLLQRFTIVFIGYSADDPPVQYLLEALNRFSRGAHPMYAFQAGAAEQALAQWSHKGVVPIPFDASRNFEALWDTLSAWAERALDTERWHRQTLALAKDGPAALPPAQRGWFVHCVRTELGSTLLAQSKEPPPAEWLITLDSDALEGEAASAGSIPTEDEADRLFAFKPDKDQGNELLPASLRSHASKPLEEVINATSSQPSGPDGTPASGIYLTGQRANQPPALSPRLLHISEWIAAVSPQPAALWWASRQSAVHPTTATLIDRQLRYSPERFVPKIRRGWRLLMQAWQQQLPPSPYDRYEIQREAEANGWTQALVRRAVELFRPRVGVQKHPSDKPPTITASGTDDPVVDFDVEYPHPPEPFAFPDAMLPYVLEQLRQTLQYAVDLEREVSGTDSLFFDTLRNTDGTALDEDGYGLSAPLATFVNTMRRLITTEPELARKEAQMWMGRSDALFVQLRIWAVGQSQLWSSTEAANQLLELATASFWDDVHERDLLISLRDRWSEFTETQRQAIERRISDEPRPYSDLSDETSFVAHRRLNRLRWLAGQGAELMEGSLARIKELQQAAPEWTEQAIDAVAQPRFGGVYTITTDSSPAQLTSVPLGKIIEEDLEAQRRDVWAKVQKHPFRGLAQERLPRAIAALTDAMRKNQFPEQAWNVVLQSDGLRASNIRVLHVLSLRLARLAPEQLAQIARPVTQWMFRHAKVLATRQSQAFDSLWAAMMDALALDAPLPSDASGQWIQNASNRPSGKLVDVAWIAENLDVVPTDQCLPDLWKTRVQQLLALPAGRRPYTIAAIARLLPSLHQANPAWVAEHLLCFAGKPGPDGDAFWSGFAASNRLPSRVLFSALRPSLLSLPTSETLERRLTQMLAATLLNQWQEDLSEPSDPLLTSRQLRDVLIRSRNSFRVQMLHQLRRWIPQHEEARRNVVVFLKFVWPRQLTARSPTASMELIELAYTVPSMYPDIMEVVLPALVPVADPMRIAMPTEASTSLAQTHPATMLAMLSAALAGHRITPTPELHRLLLTIKASPEVARDARLAELMRRAHVSSG